VLDWAGVADRDVLDNSRWAAVLGDASGERTGRTDRVDSRDTANSGGSDGGQWSIDDRAQAQIKLDGRPIVHVRVRDSEVHPDGCVRGNSSSGRSEWAESRAIFDSTLTWTTVVSISRESHSVSSLVTISCPSKHSDHSGQENRDPRSWKRTSFPMTDRWTLHGFISSLAERHGQWTSRFFLSRFPHYSVPLQFFNSPMLLPQVLSWLFQSVLSSVLHWPRYVS
jgi:hypothetical protein